MQICIGTKIIKSLPMTRQEYNDYRGWQLPENENGADDGFLVEYVDGGQSNHESHEGYISWSPKEVFDRAYQPVTRMTFGHAIEMLKLGHKVARAGWNGKGMWLILVPGTREATLRAGTPYAKALNQESCEILPHIDMWTLNASGRRAMLPGWLASQSDMLADDWMVIPSEHEISMAVGTTVAKASASAAPALEWSPTLLDGKRVSRKEAEAAVVELGEGWRLPTVDELQTLLDRSRHDPAVDTEKFPDTKSSPYWTSSVCAWYSDARWVVHFSNGGVGGGGDGYACVRACRASQ